MSEEPLEQGTVRMEGRRRPARDRGRGRARDAAVEQDLTVYKPRGVGGLLDLSIDVFVGRFWALLACSLAVWAPVRALQPFFGVHTLEDPDVGAGHAFLTMGLAMGGPLVARLLVIGMVTVYACSKLEGVEITLREALARSLKLFVALGILVFLMGLASMAYCFLIVPGLILTWKLYAAIPAAVVEGSGQSAEKDRETNWIVRWCFMPVGTGLSRSWVLTRGGFWRWLGITIVASPIVWMLEGAAAVGDQPQLRPELIDGLGVTPAMFDLGLVLFSAFFMAISSAAQGVMAAVYYLDCRVRNEGYDLQMRLDELQEEASPEPPAPPGPQAAPAT